MLSAFSPVMRCTIEDGLAATGWVVLIIGGALFLALVAAIYTIVAGKAPPILVQILSFPPWFFMAGMVLQLIRMGLLTVVGWRDQNGPPPDQLLHWLLTAHDSDLVIQALVAVGIVALEIRTWF